MRYVSLFSGIEATSVAAPNGWEAVAFSEIDPFACAVLAERFPEVPNLGDIREIDWSTIGAVDVVCGGSPCQSFSVSGDRTGLDGESRLMWEYIRAVEEIRPRWFVWENVPGVLSVKDNAFGQFIGEMDEIGYSTAWRVLDAQFFGVAQRRRRVWVVGASRDAFGDFAAGRAAGVLFEREGVSGNLGTSKQKREELAAADGRGSGKSYTLKIRHSGSDLPAGVRAGVGALIQTDVSATLQTINEQTLFCVESDAVNACINEELAPTLKIGGGRPYVFAGLGDGSAGALCASDSKGVSNRMVESGHLVADGEGIMSVRKLTPVECERLQGFPDGWTDVRFNGKPAGKTNRYRVLGNSWAVPCARWIFERLDYVDSLGE